MKLNWAERWAVNNPSRPIQQGLEIRWMKRRRPLAPGGAVLEVGCGRGAGAAIIRKEFQPALLQAMDLDLEMLRRGRTYLPEGENQKISFYVADVLRIPARPGSLDAVGSVTFVARKPQGRLYFVASKSCSAAQIRR